MALGEALWSAGIPPWDQRGSFLLLNPRLPTAVQERVRATMFPELREHVWVATSGTGGRLKIVALSRDAVEASARAVNEHLGCDGRDVWLNALPLFHVGGLGILVRASLAGARHEILSGAWDAAAFCAAAERTGATLSALVPAQVHDLVRARCRAPRCVRAVVVGGGALPEKLRREAVALGWPLLPSYGLTEAASQVATARSGTDEAEWLPLLGHVEAQISDDGVLALRGASLLSGWMIFDAAGAARWEDPKRGGWYRTADRAELRGGEIRVLGRADDLVKIRGELVDVAALETALQERVSSGVVIVRAEADERNGAVLRVRAENPAALSEARAAVDTFPPFARPEIFEMAPIETTALGKPLRSR